MILIINKQTYKGLNESRKLPLICTFFIVISSKELLNMTRITTLNILYQISSHMLSFLYPKDNKICLLLKT